MWTEEKLEKLKELYPNNKTEDIANILKMDYNVVQNKACYLKLKKSKEHKSKMISNRNKMVGRDLTHEKLKEIASKYKSRGEFQRLDPSSYVTARNNGYLDEICSHMIKHNYSIPQLVLLCIVEKIFDEKIMYNTRKIIKPYELDIYLPELKIAFEYDGKGWHQENENDKIKNKKCEEKGINLYRLKENSRDYINDVKKQMIDFFPNMSNKIINLTDEYINNFINDKINDEEDIKKIINKYETYHDFIINENKLYQKLRRRGVIKEYTKHLKRTRIKWTEEKIKNEVKKYDYLLDFIKDSNSCYLYVKRHNLESLIKSLKRK